MRDKQGGLSIFVSLLLLAVPIFIWWKFQALEDWWLLRNYTPPTSIVNLAGQDTMTDSAKHIFYVNHPQLISDVNTFRQNCKQDEQTVILGCYHSRQTGIAIFDVSEKRLNGVEQVTAAHEMLHAAYERLDKKTKDNIDKQLIEYYKNDLKDKRILDTISLYKKTEPESIIDEMHSVFGTEASNLPGPLEKYYSRYFVKRSAVVAYVNKYDSEFNRLQNVIDKYDVQLQSQKDQIQTQQQQLRDEANSLNTERQRLNSLRQNSDDRAYNSAVAEFNNRVSDYNQSVASLQAQITDYNDLVRERNDVAKQLGNLYAAIDTRLTTQQSE